jgi:predicted nucleic acid-binding protein
MGSVGRLSLLVTLYGEVLVPQAVWSEVVRDGRPGAPEVASATWIRAVPVVNRLRVAELLKHVGPGEAEAIALAEESPAEVLLINERRARKIALDLGLPITGVLGVLLEAKQKGLIPAIKPVLDDMTSTVAFRIKRKLYEAALRSAGEL